MRMPRHAFLLLAAGAAALSPASDFSSAAGKIAGPVRAVACVGCAGEAYVAPPVLPALDGGAGVTEGDTSVVVVDAGAVAADASAADAESVAAMLAADVIIYRAGDAGLAGLVAALELDLEARAAAGAPAAPKALVIVAEDAKKATSDLERAWAALAKPPSMESAPLASVASVAVVAASGAAEAVEKALGAASSETSGAAAVARLQAAKKAAKRGLKAAGAAPEAEVASASAVAAAAAAALETALPKAAAAMHERLDLGAAFCETLGAECEAAVAEVVEGFQAAAGGGALAAAAGARVAGDARRALEKAILPRQLELLRATAFEDLKGRLKGLRVEAGVRREAQKMVAASVGVFDAKAKKALAGTPWTARAARRQLASALSDFVTDRLDAAVLSGTNIPEGGGWRKLWPFPLGLSFHWLQPAALGAAADRSAGLTASDLKRFNVKPEDVDKPAFSIPQAVSQFTRGMISTGNNAAPVE